MPASLGEALGMPTRANGQLAVGCYLVDATAGRYMAAVLDVTLRGDRIREVTSFISPEVFARFGLPAQVAA